MANRYYGVYGNNGIGVFDNWARVMQSKPYIRKFMNKKFETVEEAKEYAVDGLIDERGMDIDFACIDLQLLSPNYFYHERQLRALVSTNK